MQTNKQKQKTTNKHGTKTNNKPMSYYKNMDMRSFVSRLSSWLDILFYYRGTNWDGYINSRSHSAYFYNVKSE